MKTAQLNLEGAHCASCVYTIEHAGRKVQGVDDVSVDVNDSTITVRYEGNPGSLERISQIVKTIGYNAEINWDSVANVQAKP